MSSPWAPSVPQAMQRHGGSNRSVPKIAPKTPKVSPPAGAERPEQSEQRGADPAKRDKP